MIGTRYRKGVKCTFHISEYALSLRYVRYDRSGVIGQVSGTLSLNLFFSHASTHNSYLSVYMNQLQSL